MKDIKGELLTNPEDILNAYRAKTVEIPQQEKENMNWFKKIIVKQALPYLIDNIEVDIDIEKDEQINILTYKVSVKIFGQTIWEKEGAETLP